jgi:hypothetical protein
VQAGIVMIMVNSGLFCPSHIKKHALSSKRAFPFAIA